MAQSGTIFADFLTAAIARDHSLVPLRAEQIPNEVDDLSGLGANFLAHLIATRDEVPQTRVRRRASTDAAIESYSHTVVSEDEVVTIKES